MAVCGLAACNWIVDPLPRGAERFAPPAVYARWWALPEECSGRSGNIRAIAWYRVPGYQFDRGGQPAAGYYNRYTKRIVLADESIIKGAAVRHEMLHALLKTGGHQRSQFLGACAPVAYCQGSCINDAGRWQLPQQGYVIMPPESLEVSSRAELLPRESDGQRWVSLEVEVRNPHGQDVLVAAPGDSRTPPTFGFRLQGPDGGTSGGEIATDSSTLYFKPFEVKRWLFEFLVASALSDRQLTPGDYVIAGDYARHRAAFDTITVSP
jgi:hypothetical protein